MSVSEAAEGDPTANPDPEVSAFSIWIFNNRLVWLLLIVLIGVGSDQASKIWVQDNLTHKREIVKEEMVDGKKVQVTEVKYRPAKPMVIIPNAFAFKYAENPAAAFSFTRGLPAVFRLPFLIGFSGLAMLVIAVWYFRIRKPDGILMSAFACIVAGALGNFIDRVRQGFVIDFFDMYAGFINPSWLHWPTYNIADVCIVVGACLVIYRTFRPLYPEDETV